MTLEDGIKTQHLRVSRDAERLGNVSEACRRHGMSRTQFYRLRQRIEQYGTDGVQPKRRQSARPTVDDPDADGAPSGGPRLGVARMRAAVVQRPARP
jgi:transposase-like protein